MSPTVRIDEEVYEWLKVQAVPFDDTPSSVLRRIAGLDEGKEASPSASRRATRTRSKRSSGRHPPMATGYELIKRWGLPVRQARFHRDGHYYEHLTQFPAALCDPNGYVIFESEEEYRACPKLHLGQQVNVKQPGIEAIPSYQEVDDPLA